MTIEHLLFLASIMLFIGLSGILIRKNILAALISIGLIFNSTILAFVSTFQHLGDLNYYFYLGAILATFLCEIIIGLAIGITSYLKYGHLDLDFFRILRG